jgi:chromosome segregation ATPase
MAFDKEFLTGVLGGIEGMDDSVKQELVEKVYKEYDTELTGIKINKEDILKEKKALEEKYRELETGASTYQATIQELEEKVKSSGTEETKKFFEGENKKLEEQFKARLTELESKNAESIAKNTELYSKYVGSKIDVELDDAMHVRKDIKPELKAHLRKIFRLEHEFDYKTVDGDQKLLSKDFKTIQDSLNGYLTTPEGQAFLINNNTGGGSTGGSTGGINLNENPWIRGKIDLTEQARILRETPQIAKTLMAQAKTT